MPEGEVSARLLPRALRMGGTHGTPWAVKALAVFGGVGLVVGALLIAGLVYIQFLWRPDPFPWACKVMTLSEPGEAEVLERYPTVAERNTACPLASPRRVHIRGDGVYPYDLLFEFDGDDAPTAKIGVASMSPGRFTLSGSPRELRPLRRPSNGLTHLFRSDEPSGTPMAFVVTDNESGVAYEHSFPVASEQCICKAFDSF